jgi:hypothetical protein
MKPNSILENFEEETSDERMVVMHVLQAHTPEHILAHTHTPTHTHMAELGRVPIEIRYFLFLHTQILDFLFRLGEVLEGERGVTDRLCTYVKYEE